MKRYDFWEKIGEGAFAEGWRVTDETGKAYACKRSRNRKLLKQEAEYMQKLNESVFPKLIEYRETEQEGYLFMELVEGCTLTEWVLLEKNRQAAGNQQELREKIVQIGLRLAEGLMPLQEREPALVFRDLKPDNIMITKDGKVRIVDLGLICPEGIRGDRGGSPGFAAPEQFAQGAEISCRADVYALGRVMEWMMVNCDAKEMMEIKHWASFSTLLQKCTFDRTDERLPSMRFMRDILQHYNSVNNRFGLNRNQRDILRGKLIVRKTVVRTGGKT